MILFLLENCLSQFSVVMLFFENVFNRWALPDAMAQAGFYHQVSFLFIFQNFPIVSYNYKYKIILEYIFPWTI